MIKNVAQALNFSTVTAEGLKPIFSQNPPLP
jgi:hypothetical protein